MPLGDPFWIVGCVDTRAQETDLTLGVSSGAVTRGIALSKANRKGDHPPARPHSFLQSQARNFSTEPQIGHVPEITGRVFRKARLCL